MNSQQRGDKTRSHILNVAVECFAKNGYDATGVAEICQRAGVTKGAFYHHFPSKQAVFLELLERWLAGLDEQMAKTYTEASDSREAFLTMAGMTREVFQVAGGQLPMFLEFWSKAARDPEIWQATINPYRRYRSLFARMIQNGIDEQVFCPADPDTMAQIVVALAIGLLLQGMLDPAGADWGSVMHTGVGIFLKSLERK